MPKYSIETDALRNPLSLSDKDADAPSGTAAKTQEAAENDLAIVSEARPNQSRDARPVSCRVAAGSKVTVAIMDSRTLVREALIAALAAAGGGVAGVEYEDPDDWHTAGSGEDVSAVLLGIGDRRADDPVLIDDLQKLGRDHPGLPVIVMGERQDSAHVLKILSHGARGYVPANVSLDVAIGALHLAIAGGAFVPAAVLMEAGRPDRDEPGSTKPPFDLTDRQAAVAEAVAQGKPNKIIAYELNLCESTVKVHIRVIMKKMLARNRTEVAFKLHRIRQQAASGSTAK
ncbi:LuxR C-terminal-related transcriptional regulator [Inquilinus sp.]|jgi:DNA-binding NarL/FixJ family response regulator|uniref:LuxR C-terminal-related transcriptional regulator n=1 Tax=Inquilinus sp. TaxID=1932117 RepID=UPI00378493F8